MSAPSELIGETTPMRPVDKPPYKLINPAYPDRPAMTPAKKYPCAPNAADLHAPVIATKKIPVKKPIA